MVALLEWKQVKIIIESNWRESLVPAAAVIPAPIAYDKVVAVKSSLVNFSDGMKWTSEN